MVITSTSGFPFQKVYIDFVIVEKQYKNKYPCIFTCVDELTRYAVAIKARDCTAITAAKKFVKHVVLKYKIPEAVVSDRGSAFLSETFSEIAKLFKIKKILEKPFKEHKYGAQYEGPFTITDFLSPVTVKIKNGNKTETVHTDKLIKA